MAYKRGIIQGLLQGGTLKVEDVFTDAVRVALRKKAYEHAAFAVQTTKETLQKLIEKALDEGLGAEELGRAIRGEFGGMSRKRGLLIARTEMTDTINDGTFQTLRKEGHHQKEWTTVIDGRERETHHKADGQVVAIDDVFKVGDSSGRYPGDDNLPVGERANCRCTIVAAGLSDDRMRTLGKTFLRAHSSIERKFVVALHRAFAEQRERILSRIPS